MKNLLVAQSGGPTTAINATVAGTVMFAKISGKIDKCYGSINGIEGVLNENLIELDQKLKNTGDIENLANTPAAALGSCRFKLKNPSEDTAQYEEIIKVFRKYQISYFVYIGGNDSMDTVQKLSDYCKAQDIHDLFIMGAPKTIDNDLEGTDHCPGFGSAAKYIATTFTEIERDISVYDREAVTIVEIMGRNAGWLTAASALSRLNGNRGPSLIYLCEVPFDHDKFLMDVRKKISEEKRGILVAVSEGLRDRNGNYISDQVDPSATDEFGHAANAAGAGKYLEKLVKEKIGCKARSVELNLMQRCAMHVASKTDIEESRILGMKAVQCALEKKTGEMAAIKRYPESGYHIDFISVPISQSANKEKKVPISWINAAGNDVTEEMITYLMPLIQGEIHIEMQNGVPVHRHLY